MKPEPDRPHPVRPTVLSGEDQAPPNELFGRYRIVHELGRGGMGVVYQAKDTRLDRVVALKVLREDALITQEALQRFEREITLTARFEHPNIVRLYERGQGPDGRRYFTMEFVQGRSLEDLLDGAPLAQAEALRLMLPLCKAVAYAHALGVLHRDIKPANVLVDAADCPRLTDFGLAGFVDAELQSGRLTQSQSTLGTPNYMPPEQAEGNTRTLDVRSDVYSLGALLYEMLTGRPPFDEGHLILTLRAVIWGRLDPPSRHMPSIHPEVETICLKALERRREHRYPTAAALAADIEAFLAGRPISARPPGPARRIAKWINRNRAGVSIAAAVVVAAAASFSLIYRQMLVAQDEERLARRALDREAREREVAERRRRQAYQMGADFDRLADVQLLRELEQEADALWPRRPERIAAYRSWLARADKLAARQPSHRATIARLQQETALDPARRVLLDALRKLVEGLARLDAQQEHGNSIAAVRARLAFAGTLATQAPRHRLAWERAIGAVERAPVYSRLRLAPTAGLIPLGPDPASGLWQFAHLGTGEIPLRDPDGWLHLTDKTGLVLVLVPAGIFHMGANPARGPNRDPEVTPSEQPVRQLTLEPFFLSKYEMTQGQWMRATGRNPSRWRAGKRVGGRQITWNNPVTHVDWPTCIRVLHQLGLDLPTEAQWEFAARAGTNTRWTYGEDWSALQGNANVADRTAKHFAESWRSDTRLNDGHFVHAPVGSFPPNRWGLHDIVGNVWEWCRDHHAGYSIDPRPVDGLRQPAKGRSRIMRGGAYSALPICGRSWFRMHALPGYVDSDLGLRPAAPINRRER